MRFEKYIVEESVISFWVEYDIYGQKEYYVHSVINNELFAGAMRITDSGMIDITEEEPDIEGLRVFGYCKHDRPTIAQVLEDYPELLEHLSAAKKEAEK